jgi:hypothetical protein
MRPISPPPGEIGRFYRSPAAWPPSSVAVWVGILTMGVGRCEDAPMLGALRSYDGPEILAIASATVLVVVSFFIFLI